MTLRSSNGSCDVVTTSDTRMSGKGDLSTDYTKGRFVSSFLGLLLGHVSTLPGVSVPFAAHTVVKTICRINPDLDLRVAAVLALRGCRRRREAADRTKNK